MTFFGLFKFFKIFFKSILLTSFFSGFIITNSLAFDFRNDKALLKLQKDNKWKIVAGLGIRDLFLLSFDGKYEPLFSINEGPFLNYPTFSTDGSKIAFCSYGKEDEMIIYDTLQKKFEKLLEKMRVSYLSWSPDGDKISFLTNYDHQNECMDLGIVHLKKRSYEIVLRKKVTALSNSTPSWFPDSKRICFVSIEGKITVIDILTKESKTIIEGDVPTISPDGETIVFRDGGVKRKIINDEIHYKRSGKNFYLYHLPSGNISIIFKGTPKFFQWGGNVWQQFHWSPDGKYLLFFRPVETLKGPKEKVYLMKLSEKKSSLIGETKRHTPGAISWIRSKTE
ncbi:MAG: PD40 domain-containing protein [Desulfobacterales bacterium]|nr:PD40 domain-containing protein [Desulfobacterales bacterium]